MTAVVTERVHLDWVLVAAAELLERDGWAVNPRDDGRRHVIGAIADVLARCEDTPVTPRAAVVIVRRYLGVELLTPWEAKQSDAAVVVGALRGAAAMWAAEANVAELAR